VESKILDVYDNIHRLGVVHNDVRRENILILKPEDSVWVIDFEHAGTGNDSAFSNERESVKEMIDKVRMEKEN